MVFPERYPIECPIVCLTPFRPSAWMISLIECQVTFVADEQYQPPLHPHVYSNGHICASIFGELPPSRNQVRPLIWGLTTR